MTPVGLILLLLTGVGPLLAWRRSSLANIAPQFLWPARRGLAAGGVAVGYFRIPLWPSGSLLRALRFRRSARSARSSGRARAIRSRNTGTDLFTAIVGLVGKNKRRYGGYIVHVGIVLICFGFAGNARKLDEQVLLKPGQETTIGRYTIKSNGVKVVDDGQKQMTTALPGGVRRRQRDRRSLSGEVGVSPPRAGADHRGRDPPDAGGGSLRRARRLRPRRPVDDAAAGRQSAGQLDLVRLRRSWRSAPASRCCRSESFAFALAKLPAEAAATTVALLLMIVAVGGTRCRRRAVWAATSNTRTSVLRADAVRETDAARDRLHLRRLRPPDARRVPQGSVRHVA